MAIDYKFRYQEILQKFISSTDTMYRLGYEEGLKAGREQANQQQMAAQQQQMAAMQQQQAAMMGGIQQDPMATEQGMEQAPMEGEIPQEQGLPQDIIGMDSESSGELDGKIAELESLLQKGEKPSYVALRKVVSEISDIKKSKHKKQEVVVSAQRKVVENLMKKWEEDIKTDKVTEDIEKIIKEKGIKLE